MEVSVLDVPWLRVFSGDNSANSSVKSSTHIGAAAVTDVALLGLDGGRLAFPSQLGPLIDQFLEQATQFLVW